eukprot:3962325-Alexandrium_andersonii.AAC.1
MLLEPGAAARLPRFLGRPVSSNIETLVCVCVSVDETLSCAGEMRGQALPDDHDCNESRESVPRGSEVIKGRPPSPWAGS